MCKGRKMKRVAKKLELRGRGLREMQQKGEAEEKEEDK